MGKRIIFLVCIIMAAAPVVAQGTEPDACFGAPPLRLVIGQEGRVTPGEPNRMRAEPTVESAEIGQIPGGESFVVLDGPVCADGYAWWRVLYNSGWGWTVEGSGDTYWVEPIAPVVYPDAHLVFAAERVADSRIYVVDVRGENLTPLIEPDQRAVGPAVSPDGAWIAYRGGTRERNYVAIVSPNGSQRRILLEDAGTKYSGLSWSPDGTQIALWLDSDGRDVNNFDLHILQVDDGTSRAVTDGAHQDHFPSSQPSWSPDGTQIAFSATFEDDTRTIHILHLEDETITTYDYVGGRPVWSPDGTAIAFYARVSEAYGVVVIDADGQNPRYPTGAGLDAYEFAWSPDGTRLVFTSQRAGESEYNIYNYDIFTVNADGSNLRQITDDEALEHCPSWSPDGSHIAYISNLDSSSGDDFAGDVYIMEADGQNVLRVTAQGGRRDICPVWIP